MSKKYNSIDDYFKSESQRYTYAVVVKHKKGEVRAYLTRAKNAQEAKRNIAKEGYIPISAKKV